MRKRVLLDKRINMFLSEKTKYEAILKRLVTAAVIAFFILSAFNYFAAPGYIAAESGGADLDLIKKEKEETQKKIEEAQKEQDAYAEQVGQVEKKLLSALGELEELNSRHAEIKSSIDKATIRLIKNEQDISRIEEELAEKTSVLNLRVAEIYKNNSRSILDVFFKTEDFVEFVSRLKLMNILLKQDIEIIYDIKEKKSKLLQISNNVLDLRDQLKTEQQKVDELLRLSQEKKEEIELIYEEKSELFSVAKANKDALIAMENQLTAKETEISNILTGYDYGVAPSGKMLWPTNGRLSSGFGYRTSSTTGRQRMHNGIDIFAPVGTPVIAADSGQVIKAEYEGGYGYAVLVYHGGGIATFYAHLSGFNVTPGQHVQKGQIIGYVGTTGYTTGPHLHFEVRVKGNARNPNEYLF
ncbi:MAG: Murein DD-endopeptidase MepM [Actinobacteria bacterium ADurb.Bin346]|nr:MAG: Murein DD-endopeptidase MepM [Actinobacteria bacterium ADurb.Bin346]